MKSADELFLALQQRYATCKSYRDLGIATGERGVLNFRTFFLRPHNFKFEWSSPQISDKAYPNVLFMDGEYVYYRRNGKVDTTLSFDVSLAGAGGASQGVANHVPCLLMPNLMDSVIVIGAPYTSSTRTDKGLLHLASTNESAQRQVELWIEEETLVLKKATIKYSLQFTATQAQQHVDKLLRNHPEMEELLPEGSPPAIDKVSTVEIEWRNVNFDGPISSDELACEEI